MWVRGPVCGLFAVNVGPAAVNVGLRQHVFAANVGAMAACLWARGITFVGRYSYECKDCDTRFDDLTDTIFAGHHQPLKVWVLCLYFMGLNISNEQIAQELALNGSDVHQMTTQLRAGIVKKSLQ